MTLRPSSLLLLTLLTAGGYFAASRLLCPGTAAPLEAAAKSSTTASTRPAAPTAKSTPADLLALLDAARAGQSPPLTSRIATWTDDEIRQALTAALTSPDLILPDSPTGRTIDLLVREWIQRDLTAFTRWLAAIQPDALRNRLTRYALIAWPKEQAEQGYAYLLSHRDATSGGNANFARATIAAGSLKASAVHGAEALAAALKTWRDLGLPHPPISAVDFPPGFDFQTFTGTGEGLRVWKGGEAQLFIDRMIAGGRDQAFDTVVLRNRETDSRFQPYTANFVHLAGETDQDQATWLGGKVAALPADERSSLISNLVINMHDPVQLENFIAALPGDDQLTVHRDLVNSIQSMGVAATLPHLEALGDPAARIAYLQDAEIVTDRTGAPPLDTGLLRAKLVEWHATPEQIAAILEHVTAH